MARLVTFAIKLTGFYLGFHWFGIWFLLPWGLTTFSVSFGKET